MLSKLPYLRGLAIINVVLNHATAWGFTAMFWWAHRYRAVESPNFDQVYSGSYLILRFIEQAVIFAVPAFLFISGFHMVLVYNRTPAEPTGKILARRVRKLITPYLVWSVLILAFQSLLDREIDPLNIARSIAIGEAAPGYYFIPLLFQLYLLTPLLLRWEHRNWKSLILVSVFLAFAVSLIRYLLILDLGFDLPRMLRILSAGWLFPFGLFWFSLGIVAGSQPDRFSGFAQRSSRLWQIGTVLFLILGVIEWEILYSLSNEVWITPAFTFIDVLFSLCLILAYAGIQDRYFLFKAPIAKLDGKTYGIYLVHTFVLVILARGIYHLIPAFLGLPVLFVILLTASGVFLPLLLMQAVGKSPAKSAYKYLFG